MADAATPCVLIPVYNHAGAIAATCDGVRRLGVPLLLIDDGSEAECAALLERLAAADDVSLVRLPVNRGKGAAVKAGLREAARLGFSHALQVDADGQHEAADLPAFINDLDADDQRLRIGYPRFDASVPRHRYYARYLTHALVWLNTLSFTLRDTMCGAKLFPVDAALRLIEAHGCGERMQFDTELPVRWLWAGGEVINLPVRVHYPLDGVSHFAMARDNALLALMHLRLFAGMLIRLPRLLERRLRRPEETYVSATQEAPQQHWARIQESGSVAGMRIMVWIRRRLGRLPFTFMLQWVILYYFVRRPLARRASRSYLMRIWPQHAGHPPRWPQRLVLRHFQAFGQSLMDKVDAWSGVPLDVRLDAADRACLDEAITGGRGGLMLVSHHGNLEICSAMSDTRDDFHVSQLMHTRNARKFNTLLKRATQQSGPEIVEVSEITPATAMRLAQRINDGGFVVIAADRVPLADDGRTRDLEFLGATAPFPEGPFWLATLLRCPIYTLGCVREGDHHRVRFQPFDDTTHLKRAEREAWRDAAMRRYVGWLGEQCREYPLQWFNFFPYWHADER